MAEQLWHNTDGLPVRFGRSQGRRKNTVSGVGKTGIEKTMGERKQLVFQVDLAGAARTLYPADRDNNGTMDGFEKGLDTFLPNGAIVFSCDVEQIVAPAGGTSYSVGTYQVDGTASSATNIVNAGTPLAAAVTLAQDSFVTASTVGTYTAGKLKFVIHYADAPVALKP